VPTILRELPFYPEPTSLRLPGGGTIPVKHDQIIVWVSITRPQAPDLPADALRFPAVLDTGFNDNFLIREEQLTAWAGSGRRSCPPSIPFARRGDLFLSAMPISGFTRTGRGRGTTSRAPSRSAWSWTRASPSGRRACRAADACPCSAFAGCVRRACNS
jgi:hypothetical protein